MIAGSRIIDARHHPFDVIFGSALGILCGWAAYRQYFPPVSHTWEKGRAYPIRSWGVPLKRPDGQVGSDGQFYVHSISKAPHVSMVHDEEDDRTALVGMDTIASHHQAEIERPSFRNFQVRGVQHGRSPGSENGLDYDQVREQAGIVSLPSEGLSRNEDNSSVGESGNAFREQMKRNRAIKEAGEGDAGHLDLK